MLSLPAIGPINAGHLILALAFLLLVPQLYLAISIVGKFQELIVLERKLGVIGFYDEIFGGRFFLARVFDRITNVLLGIKANRQADNRTRMNLVLNLLSLAIWFFAIGFFALVLVTVGRVDAFSQNTNAAETGTLTWQFSASDFILACLQIGAIILSVYLGYCLSERSRNRQQLQHEYGTIGHPFQVVIREALRKAQDIEQAYDQHKSTGGAFAGSLLLAAINTYTQLNDFLEFYDQKQRETSGFPKTVALPLTVDSDLNSRLWEAYLCGRECIDATRVAGDDQEERLAKSLRRLIQSAQSAIDLIGERYGDLVNH